MLDALGAPGLSPAARDPLRHCLLYERDGELVLHDTLRRDALEQRWLTDVERRQTHRQLAHLDAATVESSTTPHLQDATEAADDALA